MVINKQYKLIKRSCQAFLYEMSAQFTNPKNGKGYQKICWNTGIGKVPDWEMEILKEMIPYDAKMWYTW